ncbi:MAG: gluconolactonase [Pirellulaceae bacterium]
MGPNGQLLHPPHGQTTEFLEGQKTRSFLMIRVAMLFVVTFMVAVVDAEDKLPQDLLAESEVQPVTELVFTEGPAYHKDGSVYYTEIAGNQILRLAPGAELADTFLRPSGRANGLMFDANGGLLACEGNEKGGLGGRRITRIDTVTKQRTVIVDNYQGKRFNSPNDLCVDNSGRIYFTDPYYGPDRDQLELDTEGVYRVDSDGKNVVRVLDKEVARPNGIAISKNNLTLFVVDNQPLIPVRKLWAFELDDKGIPTGRRRELHDFGKGRGGDGMCIDEEDNLYVTAGANRNYTNQNTDNRAGVYVFNAKGKHVGVIPIPEDMVTNCCFGGPDKKTLYVTAGKTLWKIQTKIAGRTAFP